eukprot:1015827-Pelagomonas_calceolata.AAC.1
MSRLAVALLDSRPYPCKPCKPCKEKETHWLKELSQCHGVSPSPEDKREAVWVRRVSRSMRPRGIRVVLSTEKLSTLTE